MLPDRDGINRRRARQGVSLGENVLTPLGRPANAPVTSNTPTDVNTNPNNGTNESNLNIQFDAEQFRTDIKTHGNNESRLESIVLNAIDYFLMKLKRPQQIPDYTVLTCLAWTVTTHSEIFRLASVLKGMCSLLKANSINRGIRTADSSSTNLGLNTTQYQLVCQILWWAFKDQVSWPEDFIEVYIEDALGEKNWTDNSDCQMFVSNIQTAFETRPSTWKIDSSKIPGSISAPSSSSLSSASSNPVNTNEETSNDGQTAISINNTEPMNVSSNEIDISNSNVDETISTTNNNTNGNSNSNGNIEQKSLVHRYEGRSQSIQKLIQSLLSNQARSRSTTGPSSVVNSQTSGPSSNPTGSSTSQPHETKKLLSLLEKVCGLSEIRLHILSRIETWLKNPNLSSAAERLMIALCENLTKPPSLSNGSSNSTNQSDLNYIDERAIELLLNLRFKVVGSNRVSKMYISCIREMLKHDVNLVEIVVRSIVHNEFQSSPIMVAIVSNNTGKNPNNMSLLQACCQAQPKLTCQSFAITIQNLLLANPFMMLGKDFDNLIRDIRTFLREIMRSAKQDFDVTRFCMYLIDMHYSSNLQNQFWAFIQQPADFVPNDITTHRLVKRLLDCDMGTREGFLTVVCDLIPMVILASAHGFLCQTGWGTVNSTTNRCSTSVQHEKWLNFINRTSLIQCASCLFFVYTVPRIFEGNTSIGSPQWTNYFYAILFTAPVQTYLRNGCWPSEESIPLRNELFRLASEVPLLGETLYLLVRIGLTNKLRINPLTTIELIDLTVRRTLEVEQKRLNELNSIYLRLPFEFSDLFVRSLFDLTRYYIPSGIALPVNYKAPENLSITDIFWKTCSTCLLLSAHDPSNLGRHIWTSVPQIRMFMEMLLTGDYTFPPRSMIESKQNLEKFYLKEKVDALSEKDLILTLETHLAHPRKIDETNSQLLGKILVLDLEKLRRPTSQEKSEKLFYTHLQGLNKTLKLSSMLCRCRSPDFILELVERNKKQQVEYVFDREISWLTGLIDSNIDCLNVFPSICLCDYFQSLTMICRNQSQKENCSKKSIVALETIRNRFKTSKNVELESILNYFCDRLTSKNSSMRVNGWFCLFVILVEKNASLSIEQILGERDFVKNCNVEEILRNLEKNSSEENALKENLGRICRIETNRVILHSSIVFLVERFRFDDFGDEKIVGEILKNFVGRHSTFSSFIQFDKTESNYRFVEIYLKFIVDLMKNRIRPLNNEKSSFFLDKLSNKEKVGAQLGCEMGAEFSLEIEPIFIEFLLIVISAVEKIEENRFDGLVEFFSELLLEENFRSAFLSEDVQYFLVKSSNRSMVERCINEASLKNCLKILEICSIEKENVDQLCRRLNEFSRSSNKQFEEIFRRSAFVVPIVNRWIVEKVPQAILLGENLRKICSKFSRTILNENSSRCVNSIWSKVRSKIENEQNQENLQVLPRRKISAPAKVRRDFSATEEEKLAVFSSSKSREKFALKNFVHLSSWSKIVERLETDFSRGKNVETVFILNLIEVFSQLSPLCAARESKMLERCREEFFLDFNVDRFEILLDLIFDENQENLLEVFQRRYKTIVEKLIEPKEKRQQFAVALKRFFVKHRNQAKMINFLWIFYLNQNEFFREIFPQIYEEIFQKIKIDHRNLCTSNDAVLHHLIVRFNSYETLSNESFIEVYRKLKIFVSFHPLFVVRHLKILKNFFLSPENILTVDEFHRRTSKKRIYFLAFFDFIQRLKPKIFDDNFRDDFQSILENFLRLAVSKPNNGPASAEFVQFVDELLSFTVEYFIVGSNENFRKLFRQKFFDKLQANFSNQRSTKIESNLSKIEMIHQSNGTTNEIIDVRLNKNQSDFHQARRTFLAAIRDNFSTNSIDEISFLLNKIKFDVERNSNNEQINVLIDVFDLFFQTRAPKEILNEIYQIIFKFIDKNPQLASIFYSTYAKCLASNNNVVFQLALEHFPQLIFYFQHRTDDLCQILIKQSLINKFDVHYFITQAIRLNNLHRYDPTFSNNNFSTQTTNFSEHH